MLAVLYETIGETDDAEREFRLAVRYDPKDGDVNNNLGAFLCRQGKGGEADPYFQVAMKDHALEISSNEVVHHLVRCVRKFKIKHYFFRLEMCKGFDTFTENSALD